MCGNCDSKTLSRRHLMAGAGALLAATTIPVSRGRAAEPAANAISPAEALDRLKAGNARYLAGEFNERDYFADRAASVAAQFPIVGVLACADSRVPLGVSGQSRVQRAGFGGLCLGARAPLNRSALVRTSSEQGQQQHAHARIVAPLRSRDRGRLHVDGRARAEVDVPGSPARQGVAAARQPLGGSSPRASVVVSSTTRPLTRRRTGLAAASAGSVQVVPLA